MRHSEDKDTKSGRTVKRKRGFRGCKCAKRENAVGANGGWKEAGMERGKARRMERRRMQNGEGGCGMEGWRAQKREGREAENGGAQKRGGGTEWREGERKNGKGDRPKMEGRKA